MNTLIVKVNLGCGHQCLDGFINIDIQYATTANRRPDILADLRETTLPDNYVDYAQAIHVFEHFYFWEVDDVLREWKRILKPGGLLVLELPDLLKCCQNIIRGGGLKVWGKTPEMYGIWALYGYPGEKDPHMAHKWGWTPRTLKALLKKHGFIKIRSCPTEWHSSGKDKRDMRLEAIKP